MTRTRLVGPMVALLISVGVAVIGPAIPALAAAPAATTVHHACTMPTSTQKHKVINLATTVKLTVQPVLPAPSDGDACQWFSPKTPSSVGYFMYALGKSGNSIYQQLLKHKGLVKPAGKGILKGTRCFSNTYWNCFIMHGHLSYVAGLKTVKTTIAVVLGQLAVKAP